jgi:hypothetical protein
MSEATIKKLTQKQMVFAYLYDEFKVDPTRYIPTWEFVGEKYLRGLQEYVMMSYKAPTRLTDIYLENPKLLVRKEITGASGAKYYAYRINATVSTSDIADSKLKAVRAKILRIKRQSNYKPVMPERV